MGVRTTLYGPIHGCLCVQEGSIVVPSIRWGMRVRRLCYRSSFSDGESLAVAVRAPHHMPRTVPV